MRRSLVFLLLSAACATPMDPVETGDCEAECAEITAICTGKVSSGTCLSTCESSADFAWAVQGSGSNACVTYYLGERDEVPCGQFASLPCSAPGNPDGGVVVSAPDAKPSPGTPDAKLDAGPTSPDAKIDAGGSLPDAGGGTVEKCPIEKTSLTVSFPFTSVSPPTVVELMGTCYKQMNGSVSEGYNSASAVYALSDATTSVSIIDVAGAGVLWEIRFYLDQAPLGSSALGQIASRTGLPSDKILQSEGRLVGTFSGKATTVGYTLPTGVTVESFVPSSSSEKGFILFRATKESYAGLQKVLSDLGSGISVTLPLQRFSSWSGAKTFVYQLRLSTGSPKVKIETVAIAP